MQFAMEALTEAFSQEMGIEVETVVSSSGKLTAQIKAGAPYDIFVSADMKYPNTLFLEGFTHFYILDSGHVDSSAQLIVIIFNSYQKF